MDIRSPRQNELAVDESLISRVPAPQAKQKQGGLPQEKIRKSGTSRLVFASYKS